MIKKYTGILLLLFIFSCSQQGSQPEYNSWLDREQFVNMLVDMHMADGTMTQLNNLGQRNKYNDREYYKAILDKYNITSDQFEETVNFYSSNPEIFEAVYDEVIERLTRIEGGLIEDTHKQNPTDTIH